MVRVGGRWVSGRPINESLVGGSAVDLLVIQLLVGLWRTCWWSVVCRWSVVL